MLVRPQDIEASEALAALGAFCRRMGREAKQGEVAARFRVPARGGRATDPKWTERRLIALRPATLRYLDTLAKKIRRERRVALEPLQLAALLLEQAVLHVSADEARDLVLAAAKRSAPRRRAA